MADVIVIGGGVIGLSIARELSSSGKETIVLEKNERAGDVTSSRNSGVIHAGIYYPKNFLKTQLCIQGNRLIYEYAKEKKINQILKKGGVRRAAAPREGGALWARTRVRPPLSKLQNALLFPPRFSDVSWELLIETEALSQLVSINSRTLLFL